MNIEPRMLRLLEVDHKHYLKLADVERLLRDMRRDILGNAVWEELEAGKRKFHLTETEQEVLNNLYFVSNCIKRQLAVACETPDEIRKVHEKIRRAYYDGKYYLSEKTTDEDGKPILLYFRKYCKGAMEARLKAEGKTQEEIEETLREKDGDPAFTSKGEFARLFESMEHAESHRTYINHNYQMNLTVNPAWMLDNKTCKEMLDKILKGDWEEDE